MSASQAEEIAGVRPILRRVVANAGMLLGGRTVNAVLGLGFMAIAARGADARLGVVQLGRQPPAAQDRAPRAARQPGHDQLAMRHGGEPRGVSRRSLAGQCENHAEEVGRRWRERRRP